MFQKIGLLYISIIIRILFCNQLNAQTNSLVVFSATGDVFQLTVDGTLINKTPNANVKAIDLIIGWHHLDVKLKRNEKDIWFKDSILIRSEEKYVNKEFTYVLVEENTSTRSATNKVKLKFISISERSGPEKPPIPDAPKEVVPLVDNNLYGNLYKAKNNRPVFFNHYNPLTSTCDTLLNDKDLKYAFNLLNKCNDTQSQFVYLNQLIENNCLTVNQLTSLLLILPMDMDRLSSAKLAYFHIIDKEHAKFILDVFKYPAMKESYIDFMKEQENKVNQKNRHCSEPLSDKQFGEVLSKIKNTAHETDKIKLAKKIVIEECLSTTQIKQMTPFFTHDREKLDFLVSACNILTDKENAKLLVSEFQSSEAKEEFLNLISK